MDLQISSQSNNYTITNNDNIVSLKQDQTLDNDQTHSQSQTIDTLKEDATSSDSRSLTEVEESISQNQPRALVKLNPADRLRQIEAGNIVSHLHSPLPDLSLGAEQISKEEIEDILKRNYGMTPDGTLEMINRQQLEKQKQVLGFLVKQLGSALFSGKSLSSISLPVTIFEPQSMLERQAYGLTYAPYFLEKAGQIEDKFEQFKLTVAHLVASLQLGVNPLKPFNPVLGETFQGVIAGCPVYLEQVSHSPQVAALQMVGKNFSIEGVLGFTASIAMNSVKSWKVGYMKTKFANTNTTVIAQYPPGYMQGTAIGKRTFQFADKFYIFDIENKLYADIDFDLNEGSLFRKKSKVPKDRFQGGIWKVNDAFVKILNAAMSKPLELSTLKFKEKEHAVQKLETIEGSWLEEVKIGDKVYWTYGATWPYKLQYFENPLLSDSNFREDILNLKLGNEEESQKAKQKVEEGTSRDNKLREQQKSKGNK